MVFYRIELERFLNGVTKEFDVFIRCKSNEKRSTRTEEILKEHNSKIKDFVNVELNSTELKYTKIKDGKHSILVKYEDVIDGTEIIVNTIKKISSDRNIKILLDISAFIKPYFFRLLKKMLIFEGYEKIFIAYTEPKYYKKNKSDSYNFGEGTKKIAEIPGFGYHENVSKKRLLVMTLGFEGNRSIDTQRNLEPDSTIAINGFPSYIIDYKDQSILLNKNFLISSESFQNMRYASASDPFETKTVLEKIYREWNENYNITVSPLGTKPMALGVALFVLKNPDVRVVFSFPGEYNELGSSEDYGKTWLYKIDNDFEKRKS